MAEVITDVEIRVVFREREIYRIIGPDGEEGTAVTAADLKRFKKSPYGLRFVDSVFDTRDPDDALMRRCYTVIGGFKVEVPCP